MVALAIFKQIENSCDWRNFSHVNKTTYRISKLLLKKIDKKSKYYKFFKDISLNPFPYFQEQMVIHDIKRIQYDRLPNRKPYGPIYIFDINNDLHHQYFVKNYYSENDSNKTMCRTLYPKTGDLQKETIYSTKNINEYIEWYKNSQMKTKINRIMLKNGSQQRHGKTQKWAKNGTLVSEKNYDHGRLHGEYKTYRANGTMRYSKIYENGKVIFHEFWNRNGNKIINEYI